MGRSEAVNRNLGSQFEFFRSDPFRKSDRVEFVAAERGADEAAASIVYNAPAERASTRISDIYRDRSGQGQMFRNTPATGNMLAVSEEHRGQGLGSAMADLVIDEHQRRFGHRSFPEADTNLSADSSAMLSKITGKHHTQTWGTGIDDPDPDDYYDDEDPSIDWGGPRRRRRPEDTFAVDELGQATDNLHGYRGDIGYSDKVSLVQPSGVTGKLRQKAAAPSTPPDLFELHPSEIPTQTDWQPGQGRLFDPGPRRSR